MLCFAATTMVLNYPQELINLPVDYPPQSRIRLFVGSERF